MPKTVTTPYGEIRKHFRMKILEEKLWADTNKLNQGKSKVFYLPGAFQVYNHFTQSVAWSNNKQRKKKCPRKCSTEKPSVVVQPFYASGSHVNATEQLPRQIFLHVTWLLKKQEHVEHKARMRSHFLPHLGNVDIFISGNQEMPVDQ